MDKNSRITTERIPFRLLAMQCCGTMLCHVNHRLPMYCSGCGSRVWPEVKGWATVTDLEASLRYSYETHQDQILNDVEKQDYDKYLDG